MLDITIDASGTIRVAGRLDSASAPRAQEYFDAVPAPEIIDLEDLDYISSAGLRVLLSTQKRIGGTGKRIRLVNLSHHVREVFRIANFQHVFEIEGL